MLIATQKIIKLLVNSIFLYYFKDHKTNNPAESKNKEVKRHHKVAERCTYSHLVEILAYHHNDGRMKVSNIL